MAVRGVYNTKQKTQILSYLSEHKQQRLGVDEVVQSLMELDVKVGKTTVYRHLEALSGQGAVHKYVSASGVTCYQYVEDASECKRHAHLVCAGCGELLHVECALMEQLKRHMLLEHGFDLDAEKTVLYGRCGRCR